MDLMSDSDPLVKMFMMKDNLPGTTWAEVGETEQIENNNNPDFAKFFEMDYFFEKKQMLKFECFDVDGSSKKWKLTLIGQIEVELGKIIGSPQHTFIQDLVHDKAKGERGKIILRGEPQAQSNDVLEV